MEIKTKYIVMHESLAQSVLKDIATFAVLVGALRANYLWLGDHAIVAGLLVGLWLYSLLTVKLGKEETHFWDKDELIEFVKNHK